MGRFLAVLADALAVIRAGLELLRLVRPAEGRGQPDVGPGGVPAGTEPRPALAPVVESPGAEAPGSPRQGGPGAVTPHAPGPSLDGRGLL